VAALRRPENRHFILGDGVRPVNDGSRNRNEHKTELEYSITSIAVIFVESLTLAVEWWKMRV
jgi:hypothetical protein